MAYCLYIEEAQSMTELSLPKFPDNRLGLKRGTILIATDQRVNQLSLEIGDKIVIGFNGQYIVCGPYTWNIAQIVNEIECGVWEIAGEIDLTDFSNSLSFAQKIEGLFLN
jgi:hypothetical protein